MGEILDVPFFPHPLEPEVAHVLSKPVSKSSRNLRVEAICKKSIHLSDRLSYCRANRRRRDFAELRYKSHIVHGTMSGIREDEGLAENSLMFCSSLYSFTS